MSGTLQNTTSESINPSPAGEAGRPGTQRPQRSLRLLAVVAAAALALALAACGGSDADAGSSESASSSAASSSDSPDSGEAAPAAPAIDLAPISDCIAAADIVVAPTAFSDSFMAEQSLAGVLDLGALGIEFGGGQLFFYETQELADAKYQSLIDSGNDQAVRQDGTAVLQYASGVQEEAADLIMGCVG